MAHGEGFRTCVGVGGEERPSQWGNCFGVFDRSVTRDDILGSRVAEYRILNFNAENLDALRKLGLKWPIQCKFLGGHHAIIHDPRIGERWYDTRFCEVCTPRDLLPVPQRQSQERDIMRGSRREEEQYISIDFQKKAEFE